jgi:hypothetical protein
MILYIRSTFFIAMLSMLFSFSVRANVEIYVKKEVDLIVWVNVIDKKLVLLLSCINIKPYSRNGVHLGMKS